MCRESHLAPLIRRGGDAMQISVPTRVTETIRYLNFNSRFYLIEIYN